MAMFKQPKKKGQRQVIKHMKTKILVECSKCHNQFWIPEDDFDVSHLQNCHWCKELAEVSKVKSDTAEADA